MKNIEYSLIFEYIKTLLNIDKFKKVDKDKKELINNINDYFKYIFSIISLEQSKDIFKLTMDFIFTENIMETFFSFLDIDNILYTEENIKHRLKVIKQISINLDKNINEKINENIFKEKVNEQTYVNIIKILKIFKKEKNSFFNCVKYNWYLIKVSLYYLMKSYYFYLLQGIKKTNNLPQENEDSTILKEEIYNFLNFYELSCKLNYEYIIDFSQIFFSLCLYDEFIDSLKKFIILNIYSCERQILFNYNSVDFSFFKLITSKDLLMILFYYMYIIKIRTHKEDSYCETEKYYFDIDDNKISIILNEYSQILINEDMKQKYEKYLSIFSNLKLYNFESEHLLYFIQRNEAENIYFTLVFFYINQKYPLYNPSLLYHIYKKYFLKNSKRFFISFINCIRDKQNQNNIPMHLLLDKDENLSNKNKKINLKLLDYDLYNKKNVLKKYIAKNLINLNYSKNSLFYEFIENKFEKAYQKNKLKKIDYIIFYYNYDKNRDIYNKICKEFIKLKIPFYYFLDYDSDINNDQNIVKIIQLLENLSKNTNQSSQYSEKSKEDNYKSKELGYYNFNNVPFSEKKKIIEIENEKLHNLYNSCFSDFHINLLFDKRKREKLFNELLIKQSKYNEINKIICNNVINKIKNLYTFFKVLKQKNKKLIELIQGNYIFLRETINILLYTIIYISSDIYNVDIIKEIKDKNQTEILNEQIYDFFRDLFINQKIYNTEILNKYFENPIIIEKNTFKLKLIKFFENNFIRNIKNINTVNIPDNEYQPYKEIIIKFCNNYYISSSFRDTFLILFEKDMNKFIDFLSIDFFDSLYKSQIFFLIIQKNFKKFLSYPEVFTTILSNEINSKTYMRLNKTIVKYILNHSEEENYDNIELINNSFIFKDLDLSLYILNNIYKKKASLFVINKIKELFEQINTNVKLFLELIKRQINNEYVFDYLFNSFSENELLELYTNNRNIIIISLYKYSEINAIKYIQSTFNNLIKFSAINDLKGILFKIFPYNENENDFPDYILKFLEESKKIKQEENKKIKFYKDEGIKNNYHKFSKELKEIKEIKTNNLKDLIIKKQIEYEPKDDINKYLLFYALLNPRIKNYETIAYLLEQCQFENFSLCLVNFVSNNLNELYNYRIMRLLDYLKHNKDKIKSLGYNLYITSEFFEKVSGVFSLTFGNLNNYEMKIFYYYIMIIILQHTPYKLINFIGIIDIKNVNNDIISRNSEIDSTHLSEKELFIILALFEKRGDTILPIQKYFPKFYSKIQNLCQKFEYLNIPRFNLKSDYDIKFINHYKNLLKNQTEQYLKYLSHFSHKNYILIIQKEYASNINIIPENFEIIDILILDLIENDNIVPFYKCDKSDEFFSNLKNLDYRLRNEKRYEINEDLNYSKLDYNGNKKGKLIKLLHNNKKKRKSKKIINLKEEIKIKYLYDNQTIYDKIFYKSIIYSLLDFNETSSYILQNNNKLIKKYKLESETPLRIYLSYLETIKSIYNSILVKNENDYYNINFLDEYEFNSSKVNEIKKKNNITLTKIISEIINAYENIGMNKNKFFDIIVIWINNFINSNNKEMKEIKEINEEKINIFSYFKYLVGNCNIIIKVIEIFNEIKEILRYTYMQENKYLLKLKTDFVHNENKEIPKKYSGESLFNLGKELVEKVNKNSLLEYNNNYNLFETIYKVYFYFNEKKEKFCETGTDLDLIEFIKNKFLSIKDF